MSEGYTKLFSTIATSTIWSEPLATRVVWITMLATADRCGEVQASVPGLARLANVSMDECVAALATFLAPDPYSRTPDNEGRRIEVVDGGWRLLNHSKYRAKLDADDRRERKAKWMAESRAKAKKSTDQPADNSGQKSPQESTASTGGQSGHITDAPTDAPTEKKEIQGASPDGEALPLTAERQSAIPYQAIVHTYNATMVNLPKVREISADRKTAMRKAWMTSDQRQSVEFWRAYFEECAAEPFTNGTGPYTGEHANWRPDFDYLMRGKVITRIFERAMDRLERSAA